MRSARHNTIASRLFAAALLLSVPAVCAQVPDEPPAGADPAFLEQVRDLRAEGKLRACVEMLESALNQWPNDPDLWLLLLDLELQRKRYAATLRLCGKAHAALGGHPGVHLRCGQAYYHLGATLGEINQRRIPGGRVGQFWNRWLIVEKGRNDSFVCCDEESALYQVRKAIDAGCVEPWAHLLHARIWQRLEHPELAWAILRAHEAQLLEQADDETLTTFAELALANQDLAAYLAYQRRRARLVPDERRDALLVETYERVAGTYGRSGRVNLQVAFLKQAAQCGEPSGPLSVQLGDALWALERGEEATIWYRRALEKEPGHADRDRLLRRIAEHAEAAAPEGQP